METIKLPNGVWQYDPGHPLGPKGGFGIVYAGYAQDYGDLAIKQIFVEAQESAHRELVIADELKGRKFEFVIPFYDAGQDTETGVNFVVMARAEKSLQQEINARKTFSESESVEILLQVINGLLEVPELVHRDLKPGNVLFHRGKWKVADFGIAKFIEESTSLQTLKSCLSPQYAAPEQWEYHHPTHAVDVYALGCIGYALITGRPPFEGTIEDLKRQHLKSEPPILKTDNSRLRSLLVMMLRKMPETRPSLERTRKLLEGMITSNDNNVSSGFSALSNAAADLMEHSAKQEAHQRTEEEELKRRNKIAREAQEILSEIVETLFDQISSYAPNAEVRGTTHRGGTYNLFPDRTIVLGTANLVVSFSRFTVIPKDAFIHSKWTVYSGAIIEVQQKSIKPYEWGANLWFTNLGKTEECRWWEVTYMSHPLTRHRQQYEPFAVDDLSLADRAASPAMDVVQFGAKPKLIDDEATDEFCNRWADLLARAAKGELQHPSYMPMD